MNQSLHKYKHLSIVERAKIELLHSQGHKQEYIANIIGVHKSTISRELSLGRHKGKYNATTANNKATKRHLLSHRHCKWDNNELLSYIETHIKRKWSPEIIAATWNQEHTEYKITHTTIYNLIHRYRPEWKRYLIYSGIHIYKPTQRSRITIPNRIDISERPAEINNRIRIGDIEADTVISSKVGKSCLAVYVDRKSRYYWVRKMKSKKSSEMLKATLLTLANTIVHSITYDNGNENVLHEEVNKEYGCKSYFCRPYRSGDKGSIENRNKILRQYLPKGTNFDLISQEKIDKIVSEINNRPMKILGWLTPKQVFFNDSLLHF